MPGISPEQAESGAQYVVEIKSIGVEGAVALREAGIEIAQAMGIPGFLTVYSRTGMEETSQATGELQHLLM